MSATPDTLQPSGGVTKWVILALAGAGAVLVLLLAMGVLPRKPAQDAAQRNAALLTLRAENPSAQHIAWSGPASLWVYMTPDGTSRDLLAQAYCAQLRTLGIGSVTVRIQDASTVNNSSPSTIGRANCARVI